MPNTTTNNQTDHSLKPNEECQFYGICTDNQHANGNNIEYAYDDRIWTSYNIFWFIMLSMATIIVIVIAVYDCCETKRRRGSYNLQAARRMEHASMSVSDVLVDFTRSQPTAMHVNVSGDGLRSDIPLRACDESDTPHHN